jgi:hypothetical protein
LTTNLYIQQGIKTEQDLYESLIIESNQIHGKDYYYLPKTVINKDELLGEESTAQFNTAFLVEMYLETFDGFEGEGDLFQKFGIEIRDQMRLTVSRKRWKEEAEAAGIDITNTQNRPFEGDAIFFPLTNTLYEVKYIEHEIPFYQLDNIPIYKLTLEKFEYNNESFNTGVPEIDSFEINYYQGGFVFKTEWYSDDDSSPVILPSPFEFVEGETYVVNTSGNTLKLYSIIEQNGTEFELNAGMIQMVNNGIGIVEGESIITGQETGNKFIINDVVSIDEATTDQEFMTGDLDQQSDNVTIEENADESISSEENNDNPFGFV